MTVNSVQTFWRPRLVVLWLLSVVVIAAWPMALIIRHGMENSSLLVIAWLMWSPGIATVLLTLFFRMKWPVPLFRRKRFRYNCVGFFTPLLAGSVVYGLVWLSPMGSLDSGTLGRLLGNLVPNFVFMLVLVLGEELGWRGFLLPALRSRFSLLTSALLVGMVWVLFHTPLIFLADYHSDIPRLFAGLFFSIGILSASVIAAVLVERSGSLWPSVLLHTAHNVFIQQWFDPLSQVSDAGRYWTSEFGLGLALAYSAIAVLLYKKQG